MTTARRLGLAREDGAEPSRDDGAAVSPPPPPDGRRRPRGGDGRERDRPSDLRGGGRARP